MTERKMPDDRELEQYLKGGSPLSRRYRDASGESSPPDLDEAILARARAEVRRERSPAATLNRYLAPVALAASVVLGVNLAWNLYQVEPLPAQKDQAFVPEPPLPAASEPAAAPAAPAPAPEAKLRRKATPERKAELAAAQREQQAAGQAKAEAEADEDRAAAARESEAQGLMQKRALAAPQARASSDAPAPVLSESAKVDRLVAYVAGLQDATFTRNGKDYGPADAAKHMQLKRDKAGKRCDTAEEFIRTCASFSSTSGEAYLIRFADGRTRTAEDVLREELARINGVRAD